MPRFSVLPAVFVLLAAPAEGFDTYWHSQCSHRVGDQFGFTEDAWKIMQLGNFSADFFGPVAEFESKGAKDSAFDALSRYKSDNPQIRGAALFLHFDNLSGDLRGNSVFDFLFGRLLQNTQTLLAGYNQLLVDDRMRKALTLVTLGASLHAVQDFYSHSDWIHNDFDKTDVKMVAQPSGSARSPSWLEFREKHADPDQWPFQVQSGVYPPVTGQRNTHTHMNHDNSRLKYTEYETPGQPSRSQAEYHASSPVPALGDDVSDLAHQQLAFNTAIAASIEWVKKVEENPGARQAIESAKTWDLKAKDRRLSKELEAGILTEMAVACATGHWDGDEPSGASAVICRSVLSRQGGSPSAGGGSQLESQIIGLAANFLMPLALRFTGMFWDIHGQYHILERLAGNFGSNSGRYNLPTK
jgi:hypothetical protein